MSSQPLPRVAFVSSHAQLGGAESYLLTLLRRIQPESIDMVISLQEGPFLERIRDLHPVVIDTSGAWRAIARSAIRLGRLLREQRPDVVHANGIKAGLVSVLATQGTNIPVLWVKHEFFWDGPLAKIVGRLAARIVGVSEAVTGIFRGRMRRKIFVVHGAVESLEEPGRSSPASDDDLVRSLHASPTIALIGRIHPVKGHEELIRILPLVRREEPSAVCAFIGPDDPSVPSHRRFLEILARDLNVEDAIIWLGQRDDARALMPSIDVGVVPSVAIGRGGREAFPLVVIEYMDAGTPVVAYDSGGISEGLDGCGLLVPAGDRNLLAQAVIRVLTDDPLREQMRLCGRKRVRELFSPERMVDSFARHYRELCGR